MHAHKRKLWALAMAVLLMQLVPMHLHLHHHDDLSGNGASHYLDVHVAGSQADDQHHEDAHVIDLDSEMVFKQWDSGLVMPLLFICLLTVLVYTSVRRISWSPESADRPLLRLFLFTPPLRAPPHA